jgi:hypothetical protein
MAVTFEKWTKNLLLFVVFIVKLARGLFPQLKILKGLKDLRLNEIGR